MLQTSVGSEVGYLLLRWPFPTWFGPNGAYHSELVFSPCFCVTIIPITGGVFVTSSTFCTLPYIKKKFRHAIRFELTQHVFCIWIIDDGILIEPERRQQEQSNLLLTRSTLSGLSGKALRRSAIP